MRKCEMCNCNAKYLYTSRVGDICKRCFTLITGAKPKIPPLAEVASKKLQPKKLSQFKA